MSTKIDPVSTIVASFPFPELSLIGDATTKPTYHSLLTAQTALNTNAASIDTTHGTGLHGLLVLTMAPTEFAAMINPPNNADADANANANANTHPAPPNPGALAPDATIAAARHHAERLFHYHTYHSTDKALKKLLLAACPDLYLSAIKHSRTGYATTTTLQMLTHLWSTYGDITPDDLNNNLTTMSQAWHPTTPIETLFQQITDGLDFAAAGDSPIDDNTAVRIVYKIVFDTGLFDLPCRDWRALPKLSKTFAHFQVAFTLANNDRSPTTTSAGYHTKTANAASSSTDTILASLLATNQALQKTIERLASNNHHHHNGNRQPNTNTSSTTTTSTSAPPTVKAYCHTHGHTCVHRATKIHNSDTCRNPGPAHNKAATATNTMGGSERTYQAPTH
jgi:hypothetical protein